MNAVPISESRIPLKPLVTMEIIAETMGSNAYGFQEIHIYEFNIDGEGSALISHDDQQALEYCHKNDLLLILCGDPEHGTRWYQPKGKIGHWRPGANLN